MGKIYFWQDFVAQKQMLSLESILMFGKVSLSWEGNRKSQKVFYSKKKQAEIHGDVPLKVNNTKVTDNNGPSELITKLVKVNKIMVIDFFYSHHRNSLKNTWS